jgi:YD repeat-containing protein
MTHSSLQLGNQLTGADDLHPALAQSFNQRGISIQVKYTPVILLSEVEGLTSVTSGTLTTEFTYDGVGNRVATTADGIETRYVLDVAGGLPVVIVATAGGSSLYYVQIQGQVLAQYDSGPYV